MRATLLSSLLMVVTGWHVLSAQSAFLPKNLGPAVNTAYDEINPVLTPDGKTLFFVRVNHPENYYGAYDSEDIWYSQKINDSTWTDAQRIPNLNVGRYNAVLSVSSDGNSILLNGIFNHKGNIWKKRGISVSTKTGDTWGKPKKVKISRFTKINRGMKSSAALSADGKYLMLSFTRRFRGEKNDLYISENDDGHWITPKKLKRVNSGRNEEAPFLSVDGKTLYFASNRVDKNKYDIYKSQLIGTGRKSWSKPVALSDTINSDGWDSWFKTTSKGSWAYFASTNKSLGKSDIYRVKLFEENPFVVVSGTIVNSKNKALLKGKTIDVKVDGKKVESIKFNSDSATYQGKLPLGKKYTLSPEAANFISTNTTLDVTKIKEFTRSTLDLELTPFPYILLKGRMLIQNSETPVPFSADPKIVINGVKADSAKIDAAQGTYEVKIPYGTSYDINVDAAKLVPVSKKLDLTTIEEYQEVTLDLFVEEKKMAVVTGKILDKKTGSPLARPGIAKVKVEGMNVSVEMDTLSGTYSLKLPLQATFTVSASAPNYYPLYETINLVNEVNNVTLNKDLVIVPIEVGQSIRLNNIFFDPAKAILKKESFPELDRVVEFLNGSQDIKIEIGGHTDNEGGAATNLKLSQNRAQAVADYIIKKGIARERVVAKGYGLTKPVASNQTKEGKAQNRRVEFTVVGK